MENSLVVIGPVALVALGLFAYLVLLWLQYQQDSSRLETREAQLHHHGQANLLASEQARAKTAQALERRRALERDILELHQQLAQLREAGNSNKEE